MKASFDGARLNLSSAYDALVLKVRDNIVLDKDELVTEMNELRQAIGGLNCMYDDTQDDDCNALDINLLEVD